MQILRAIYSRLRAPAWTVTNGCGAGNLRKTPSSFPVSCRWR
jgi:hypothetical protein